MDHFPLPWGSNTNCEQGSRAALIRPDSSWPVAPVPFLLSVSFWNSSKVSHTSCLLCVSSSFSSSGIIPNCSSSFSLNAISWEGFFWCLDLRSTFVLPLHVPLYYLSEFVITLAYFLTHFPTGLSVFPHWTRSSLKNRELHWLRGTCSPTTDT